MTLRAPAALSFLVGGKTPDMVSNVGSNYNPSQPPLRCVPRARYARPLHYAPWPLLCGEIGTGQWLSHPPVLFYRLTPSGPLAPWLSPAGSACPRLARRNSTDSLASRWSLAPMSPLRTDVILQSLALRAQIIHARPPRGGCAPSPLLVVRVLALFVPPSALASCFHYSCG